MQGLRAHIQRAGHMPLSGLHHKERGLSFSKLLSMGETVEASAVLRDAAVTTAFLWRHCFLRAVEKAPDKPRGLSRPTMFSRASRPGGSWTARRADMVAGPPLRGRRAEVVPVLVAADRGGGTHDTTAEASDSVSRTDSCGSGRTTARSGQVQSLIREGSPFFTTTARAPSAISKRHP